MIHLLLNHNHLSFQYHWLPLNANTEQQMVTNTVSVEWVYSHKGSPSTGKYLCSHFCVLISQTITDDRLSWSISVFIIEAGRLMPPFIKNTQWQFCFFWFCDMPHDFLQKFGLQQLFINDEVCSPVLSWSRSAVQTSKSIYAAGWLMTMANIGFFFTPTSP